MKWKKKAASMLLAGCLVLSAAPTAAFAAGTEVSADVSMQVAENLVYYVGGSAVGDTTSDGHNITHTTLKDAVEKANDATTGSDTVTIVLEKNFTGAPDLSITGNIILDLNGHTVKSDQITVDDKANLTIRDSSESENGMITNKTSSGSSKNLIKVEGTGNLKIESGTIESSDNTYSTIMNQGNLAVSGGKISSKGTGTAAINNKAKDLAAGKQVTCTITGGEISATQTAVGMLGKGSMPPDNNDVTVDISGGKLTSGGNTINTNASSGQYAGFNLTIRDGAEIESTGAGAAIYLSGAGKTDILGGKITGKAMGVRIAAGELNVIGGTIESTEADSGSSLTGGSSAGYTGAIVVGKANATGYPGNVDVNIEPDAEITNPSGNAIVVSDENMNGTDKIDVTVESQHVTGDVVEKTAGGSTGGANTSVTLDGAVVDGNVTNGSSNGTMQIKGSTINGQVKAGANNNVIVNDSSIEDIDSTNSSNVKLVGTENTVGGVKAESTAPAIDFVGFKADAADANKAINDAITEKDGSAEKATVADSGKNTMYTVLTGRTNLIGYTITVTFGDTEVYKSTDDFKTGADHLVSYFSFAEDNSNDVDEPLKEGEYTVTLSDSAGTTLSSETITILKVTFDANGGEFEAGANVGVLDGGTYKATLYADEKDLQEATNAVDEIAPALKAREGYKPGTWGEPSIDDSVTYTATVTAQWEKEPEPEQKPEVKPGGGQVTTPGGTDEPDNPNPPAETTNYKVTVASDIANGTVTADKTEAAKDDKVTLTVKANEGYEADTVTATDKDGKAVEVTKNEDGTYSFTMPESDVTVTATFKETVADEKDPVCGDYSDVDEDEWYHKAVHYMIENGYMTGMPDGKFEPSTTLNRAMVAQILYAKAGKPETSVTNRFSDVKAGDWYAEAVTWAAANGVTAGYTDGTFRPYAAVSRQELAVMLYGDADQPTVTGTLNTYPDYQSVADWAVNGVTWAVQNGIISGVEQADKSVTLSPAKGAMRSEAAAMFMQYFT